MAIKNRTGQDLWFDPNKMLPGEMAVSTDAKRVYVAFAPGDVREFAFKDQIPIVGDITPDKLQEAVNNYLNENPVHAGATEEEAKQIELNRKNIGANDEAIQEVGEEVKKTNANVSQLSNPNLFINGNFQIWSNGEEFNISLNEDGSYGGYEVTADRWTVGAWGSNIATVFKTDKGLTFTREQSEPIVVFQVLDEETLRGILGKPLTMSYATENNSTGERQEYTRSIVLKEDIEIEPFAIAETYFSIELEMGYTLCCAKLEVGDIATPCVPDSKDVIICKLEHESEKQLKIQRNLIVQGNTTGIYSHEDLKHANGLIVLCMAPNVSSYFVCQPMLLPNIGHHFVFDKNGEMYTACIQWNKDEGIVKCMNRDDIYIHTISALF